MARRGGGPASRKDKAHRRAPKPVFVLTGLIVGGSVGLVVGLIVGILRHQSTIMTQIGGLAGIAFGALGEALRLWWRLRKAHHAAGKE